MASFETAYTTYILPNEGGYANIKQDKGKRTYAGIAEAFNPTWKGWPLLNIEEKKVKGGKIKNNTKFAHLQPLVTKFYRDRWNKNRFGEIKSQKIANLLYDFHVHSQSTAIKFIQQLVGVRGTGVMDSPTINAINNFIPDTLHDLLLQKRRAFLESLIAKDPTQEVFRKGWMQRLDKFKTFITNKDNALPIGGIVLGAGITLYLLFAPKQKQKQAA